MLLTSATTATGFSQNRSMSATAMAVSSSSSSTSIASWAITRYSLALSSTHSRQSYELHIKKGKQSQYARISEGGNLEESKLTVVHRDYCSAFTGKEKNHSLRWIEHYLCSFPLSIIRTQENF